MKYLITTLIGFVLAFAPQPGFAQELPAAVSQVAAVPLMKVGSGDYKKIGMTIYHATLWAPEGTWNAKRPYALQLVYDLDIDQQRLIESVERDIRKQHVADDETLARWERTLEKTLPSVRKGDVMVGLTIPGREARMYLNGKQIARIQDPELADAFFAIWLGKQANGTMREALLTPTAR